MTQLMLPGTENRPLPELIADFYGFDLAFTDVDGERWYAIQDWLVGVAQTTNPRRFWSDFKRSLKKAGIELYVSIVQLPYTAANGKTYKVDHATAEGLYFITGKMDADTGLRDKVLKYLAKAGVKMDEDRLNRTSKKQIPFKQGKQFRNLLDSGYDPDQAVQWSETRDQGKSNRSLATARWAGRGNIAILTNKVTQVATGRDVKTWKKTLNIKESPRNYLGTLNLMLIALIEGTASVISAARGSQTTEELSEDIDTASKYIDVERLRRDLPNMTIVRRRELPPPRQQRLDE